MDTAEEKFFEFLAKSGGKRMPERIEAEPEAQLAKASVPVREGKVSLRRERKDDYGQEGQLTIDVYQTANDIVVESAIAGVRAEDIDIDVSNDSVSIRGERHREKEVSDEDYFYQECYWGRFSRSVILPQEIDPEAATVSFKNGILTVRLPKLNRRRTKKLQVRYE
jgi:HSP20 family molecular chaperone IbpA